MTFILHPNLQKKTWVIDLPLSSILLEDNSLYPWIFLVPRREKISRIMELPFSDQLQLIRELDLIQKFMWSEFRPTQLNVAAIGNKTPQLHIHVIARYEDDPAWPHTVWDHPARAAYDVELKHSRLLRFRDFFSTYDWGGMA